MSHMLKNVCKEICLGETFENCWHENTKEFTSVLFVVKHSHKNMDYTVMLKYFVKNINILHAWYVTKCLHGNIPWRDIWIMFMKILNSSCHTLIIWLIFTLLFFFWNKNFLPSLLHAKRSPSNSAVGLEILHNPVLPWKRHL